MTTNTGSMIEEDISADEDAVTAAFVEFLKAVSSRRHPSGVVPRFNQGRAAGCVDAEFEVPDGLAPELRVGLFAEPTTYQARIRFAHATSQSDRDKDVRGMSIKVLNVGGDNLTAGESTHDFILNSHPVMMVPDTRTFLQLLRAVEAGGARMAFFFLVHPRAAAVALASRRNTSSHLEIPYWSTTPYLFGTDRAVKYVVRPVAAPQTPLPAPLTDHYLSERLAAHLARDDARFELCVQFRTDVRRMPIEDAAVEWREQDSPYRRVARIRIPSQRFDSAGANDACEQISFNPWHARVEHRPLGNLNRARRDIYRAMAAYRQERL